MKSSRKNLPVRDAGAIGHANPELDYMPQEEESDSMRALLKRVADRDHYESASFAYPDEMDKADYVDKEALHRIVEDLQFGRDLRL